VASSSRRFGFEGSQSIAWVALPPTTFRETAGAVGLFWFACRLGLTPIVTLKLCAGRPKESEFANGAASSTRMYCTAPEVSMSAENERCTDVSVPVCEPLPVPVPQLRSIGCPKPSWGMSG